jgi:hypothetical protein
MKIPALSLTAPYGTLISINAKCIETRSWSTKYRGLLAIHQAKSLKPIGGIDGLYELCNSEPFESVLRRPQHRDPWFTFTGVNAAALPFGKIVAIVRLIGCIPTRQATDARFSLSDQERAFGDYSDGRHAWLLRDVWELPEPVEARGKQGLWRWQVPDGLTAEIQARFGPI